MDFPCILFLFFWNILLIMLCLSVYNWHAASQRVLSQWGCWNRFTVLFCFVLFSTRLLSYTADADVKVLCLVFDIVSDCFGIPNIRSSHACVLGHFAFWAPCQSGPRQTLNKKLLSKHIVHPSIYHSYISWDFIISQELLAAVGIRKINHILFF